MKNVSDESRAAIFQKKLILSKSSQQKTSKEKQIKAKKVGYN